MSGEGSVIQVQRAVRLFRAASLAVGAGATVNQDKVNLGGHSVVRGAYHQTAGTAPAAGFPRIRQSADGVTWDMVAVVPQDLSQLPEVVFPFNELILLPYVAIEWTNGAAPTTINATAWALPVGSGGIAGTTPAPPPPAPSALGTLQAPIEAALLGANTLVAAPAAGLRIYVWQLIFVTAGAVNVRLLSNATNLTGLMTFTAAGGAFAVDSPGGIRPVYTCEVAQPLTANLSAAVGINGSLVYTVDT